MIRIFLTSSHLSTVFMAIYARKTSEPGMTDILVIDDFFKKESLLEHIRRTSEIHKWAEIVDFSTKIEDAVNVKTSTRKKLTRKVKVLPGIKLLYSFLLRKYENKQIEGQLNRLSTELPVSSDQDEHVSLFMLTQTALNKSLIKRFPKASVNYMEHGIGDYFYVEKIREKISGFYCLFDSSFRKFLERKGNVNAEAIFPYLTRSDFEDSFSIVAEQTLRHSNLLHPDKRYVLILLDAFECYQPPKQFWTDYVTKCVANAGRNNCFVVKPHPNQSHDSISLTKSYFENEGLDFVFLNEPEQISIAAEALYIKYKHQVSAVFSTFSSATFYLAKFYHEKSDFFILYDFVSQYIHHAPKQYKEIFHGFNEMIKEVFSEGKIKRL